MHGLEKGKPVVDFMPYWGFGAQLRLEGKTGQKSDKQALSDMRGEAVRMRDCSIWCNERIALVGQSFSLGI